MSAESDFTRALASWLKEDAGEDPAPVLARVEARVANRRRRAVVWPFPQGLGYLGQSARFVIAGLLVIAVALGAYALGRRSTFGPAVTPSPSLSPSSGSPTSAPQALVPSGQGIANDEPCTRTQSAVELNVRPVGFHHEDLEHMVLGSADVGGLPDFYQDVERQGYHDNPELAALQPNDPGSICDDAVRFGRIEGYGNVYDSAGGTRMVLFAVHLFWTAEDAAAWSKAYTDGLAPAPGDTSYTFELVPAGLNIQDAALWIHTGRDGIRTWAIIQRGPVIGWIVDLHPEGSEAIDVAAAAALMATRIETVSAAVAARAPAGLDAVQLLSAPLPQSAWGDTAASLNWDPFFGGCQDTAERGFIVGEKAVADAARFGRLTGCTAMYANPGQAQDIVRVFSMVQVYRDADGASGALAAETADEKAQNAGTFDGVEFGDESIGFLTSSATGPRDTRLVMRVGNLLAIVSFQGSVAPERIDYVLEMARLLELRLDAILAPGS